MQGDRFSVEVVSELKNETGFVRGVARTRTIVCIADGSFSIGLGTTAGQPETTSLAAGSILENSEVTAEFGVMCFGVMIRNCGFRKKPPPSVEATQECDHAILLYS